MSDNETVYWVSHIFDPPTIMSGTAVRCDGGWQATPNPGIARFVDRVHPTFTEARRAAFCYCTARVRFWQQEARKFKEKS